MSGNLDEILLVTIEYFQYFIAVLQILAGDFQLGSAYFNSLLQFGIQGANGGLGLLISDGMADRTFQ